MHAIEFKLQPSKKYLILLTILLAVSSMIVLSLPFNLGVKIIGLLFVGCYGGWLVWHVGLLRSPWAVTCLQPCGENQWLLQTSHSSYLAELRGDSTLTRWVAVLRFNHPQQFMPSSCIIFRDSFLEADLYRQLLIHCRSPLHRVRSPMLVNGNKSE